MTDRSFASPKNDIPKQFLTFSTFDVFTFYNLKNIYLLQHVMLTTICYPDFHQHQRLCNLCCLKCQLKEIVSAAREIFRFKVGGVLDYKSASHVEC